MGKGEEKPEEQSEEEKADNVDETVENDADSETKEEKAAQSPTETTPNIEEAEVKEPADTKTDVESLRRVIKLESSEETESEEKKSETSDEKKEETPKEDDKSDDSGDVAGPDEAAEATTGTTTRESLEQKRAILQSIKDFDFQIKKNQEEIGGLNQKLDSLSKDLDDLVSLYEIVSEQMNPFVGLSKVTKKRIDALENFTKEIESLKTRVGDLESFAEQTGVKIEDFRERGEQQSTPTVDSHTKKYKSEEIPDVDLEKIVEKALDVLSSDDKVDLEIDKFIESLKGEK